MEVVGCWCSSSRWCCRRTCPASSRPGHSGRGCTCMLNTIQDDVPSSVLHGSHGCVHILMHTPALQLPMAPTNAKNTPAQAHDSYILLSNNTLTLPNRSVLIVIGSQADTASTSLTCLQRTCPILHPRWLRLRGLLQAWQGLGWVQGRPEVRHILGVHHKGRLC